LFSRETVAWFQRELKAIPWLDQMYNRLMAQIQTKISTDPSQVTKIDKGTNVFGIIWNVFMSLMILYFLLSTIESCALQEIKDSTKLSKKKKQ
jgi:hypothetical protein